MYNIYILEYIRLNISAHLLVNSKKTHNIKHNNKEERKKLFTVHNEDSIWSNISFVCIDNFSSKAMFAKILAIALTFIS